MRRALLIFDHDSMIFLTGVYLLHFNFYLFSSGLKPIIKSNTRTWQSYATLVFSCMGTYMTKSYFALLGLCLLFLMIKAIAIATSMPGKGEEIYYSMHQEEIRNDPSNS